VSYYMFYFNKVVDKGETKSLLLLIDSSNGIDETSPIYRIDAIRDGDTDYGVGNFANRIKLSGDKLISSSTAFTCKRGSLFN